MSQHAPAKCDVAIIGGGVSGLTAAVLLSRSGLKVKVFEAQSQPGGYLMGFSRKGFVFDTALQYLNQCGPGGFCTKLFEHLGGGQPWCKPLTGIRRYKGESFDYRLSATPGEFEQNLTRDFPGEASGIGRFFDDVKLLASRLPVLDERMRAPETMSILKKTVFGLRMLSWYLPVRKIIRATAEEGLGRYFQDENLLKIFCAEKTLMAAVVPIAWSYTKDLQAPPEGGGQALVQWLLNLISQAGGEVFLKSPVQQVLLDGKRARSVKLASGEEVSAKYVLAACDVEALYERMLPEGAVPQKLLKKLHDADLYYSMVTLFIGLDCEAESLGLGEEIVCLTRDDVSRQEQSGGDMEKTSLIVLAPSARDKTLAPAGKGSITIHAPAYLNDYDEWKTGEGFERGPEYRKLKEQVAEILLDRVERDLVPDLRKHIEVLETATPVTYLRYTGNRAGSIMGSEPTDKNIKARLAHYRTPVKNLLLAGHWAEYGGGLPMAMKAAANTSLLILKNENHQKFNELVSMMDKKLNGKSKL